MFREHAGVKMNQRGVNRIIGRAVIYWQSSIFVTFLRIKRNLMTGHGNDKIQKIFYMNIFPLITLHEYLSSHMLEKKRNANLSPYIKKSNL